MQLFYVPDIKGSRCELDRNESRHCTRVMRMTRGDTIMITDGRGNLYEGVIDDPDPSACRVNITGKTTGAGEKNYRLHMAISPLKNPERFEWFVEKSVELGIDEITPLICHNTEKTRIKAERMENIIISAMKQSLKTLKPVLHEPVSFLTFIADATDGIRMIPHCNSDMERKPFGSVYRKGCDATILIGPEGDFTPEEISAAIEKGFSPVHLGSSRLRTETAGIAACHSVYYINQ
ncbi:MAG: 16S rRNA (uracil(1498)-N(3))-methyltransferase [Bacteroidales bacterium]|jgi:16S rRNA (uracil1498-N3)-methyltransferase|nr:16S rRNA (uracil(1498)-N(3))-methyltransferase [Bacteroidales bacterium]